MILFDLLSLFYAVVGLRTIVTAWQHRSSLVDGELTAPDRALIDQLVYFVLIPPGVFLHELGHALATLQLGGRVGEFHFALFWGYVVPIGSFTPLGEWWIAVSGNLVSIAYGLLAFPLLLAARSDWQKYSLLAFARIQLTWALIGYPLITFLGFEGDWSTIYSPSTWQIGVPFGVLHLALIAGLWALNRSAAVRRWEVSLYAGAAGQLARADERTVARPGDAGGLIERGNVYAQNNMLDAARAEYERALGLDPGNPRALFNLGQVELERNQPRAAEARFRRALERTTGDTRLAARTHYGLGLSLFQQGKREEAVAELDRALSYEPDVPEYYFWRGMAQRGLRQDARARADLTRAAELARTTNPPLAARAREMIKET